MISSPSSPAHLVHMCVRASVLKFHCQIKCKGLHYLVPSDPCQGGSNYAILRRELSYLLTERFSSNWVLSSSVA